MHTGERLAFATKLWATQNHNQLALHQTSRSPSPACASDRGPPPLLLQAPAATPALPSIPSHGVHQAEGHGGAAPHAARHEEPVVRSIVPSAVGSLSGMQMQREVATLRQDRDALLAAMQKLRGVFARQVRTIQPRRRYLASPPSPHRGCTAWIPSLRRSPLQG